MSLIKVADIVLLTVRLILLGVAAAVVTVGIFLALRDAGLPELGVAWLILAFVAGAAALYRTLRRRMQAEDSRRCDR